VARIAAVGEDARIAGFALAGALIVPAETPDDVRAAWEALPADVGLVVLTPAAATALAPDLDDPGARLTAVMPA
jgi:vacuolar-type H+-ATPase subunit F/Vma7